MSAHQDHIHFVEVTPTIGTSAYATGELIGTKMTFSNAFPLATGCGLLRSVIVEDLAGQTGAFDLILFDSDPSGTTFTDKAAFDIADADLPKIIAAINFGASSQFAFADNSVKFLGNLQIPLRGILTNAPARTVYGALVARAAQTYATAADVTVTLGITHT
jgi:hypothetical protein